MSLRVRARAGVHAVLRRCLPVWALSMAAGCQAQGAAAPVLAYVLEARNGHELRLVQWPGGTAERVELMLERPDAIVWRTDRPEVITVRGDGVYATPYTRKPYTSTSVGDPAPKGIAVEDGWIGDDGRLRVVGSGAGPGGATLCAVYAVPDTGTWQRQAQPAPAAATDGSCQAYADRHRHTARSVSSAALMRDYRCAGQALACTQLGDARHAAVRQAYASVARGHDTVAVTDPGSTAYLLVSGVTTGDTPHFTAPAHLVRRSDRAVIRPALPVGPQLQVGLNGTLALVATEYAGGDARVVDLNSGKILHSARGSTAAVWVPVAQAAR